MATIDLTNGVAAVPFSGVDKVYRIDNTIDFSANPGAIADVIQTLNVGAATQVLNVFTTIVTPEGAVSTGTVGDGADPNGFDASVDLNAAVGTVTGGTGGTDAYVTSGGRLYGAADTIDLVLVAAASTAKIRVSALCVDLN